MKTISRIKKPLKLLVVCTMLPLAKSYFLMS